LARDFFACRASRAGARRALVLRTEPPSASRPFGLRSLTQAVSAAGHLQESAITRGLQKRTFVRRRMPAWRSYLQPMVLKFDIVGVTGAIPGKKPDDVSSSSTRRSTSKEGSGRLPFRRSRREDYQRLPAAPREHRAVRSSRGHGGNQGQRYQSGYLALCQHGRGRG
jgi:hypothetical protein